MTLEEKLLNIQSELKAPKGQYNSFGKYKYRSCEDILEAVKPLLGKYKCLLTIEDEIVPVGGRVYVRATATIYDSDNRGDKLTVSAYAREEDEKKGMDGSQITGASSSYARKYALNGIFLIDDTKDSDATNTHGNNEEPKATNTHGNNEEPKATNTHGNNEEPKATPEQIEKLKSYVSDEKGMKAMLDYCKVGKLEDITMSQASKIIKEKSK